MFAGTLIIVFDCSAQLTVIASDQRGFGPQVRSTIGTFRVNILDVNDNIPTFTMPVSQHIMLPRYRIIDS